MGEQKKETSGIGIIAKRVAEISGYVAGIVTYIAALTGRLETAYPTTVSTLTLLVTVAVLWAWRWPRIKERTVTAKTKPGRKAKEGPPAGFFEALTDPLKASRREAYSLSLLQRRAETFILLILSVIAILRLVTVAKIILLEFNPPPYSMSCDQPVEEGDLIAAVASFYETGGNETVFESRIHDELLIQVQGEARICYLENVIEDRPQARKARQDNGIHFLIWGRSDKDAVDVHLEVLGWDMLSESIWSFPAVETGFQQVESEHLTFLARYGFSLLQYIDGRLPDARLGLESALGEASSQPWAADPGNATDLADAHFLLGLIYGEDDSLPEPDRYEKARDHYTEAVQLNPGADEAILNRGQTCVDLQDLECAMQDFTTLIDRRSDLAAEAHINRSYIQPAVDLAKQDLDAAVALDPAQGYSARGDARLEWGEFAGAISDLQSAVEYAPGDQDLRHSLGKARLLSGDCAGAVQTYKDALPFMDEGGREFFIGDLETLSPSPDSGDCFDGAIEEIVKLLKQP